MTRSDTSERLIVFDCDGVLVDSEALVVALEAQLLTEAGFPMTVDDVIETCVGLSYPDMMAMLEKRFGEPVPDSLVATIQSDALASFPDQLEPVAGIPHLLENLTDRRCVASSSDIDRITLSLDITGLAQHFDAGTIFSAQMVRRGKPAPDLFLHAASNLQTDPTDCVVIEDSPHGVTAAIAAGMAVIGFTGGLHARPSLVDRLHAAGARRIAGDSAELREMLHEP